MQITLQIDTDGLLPVPTLIAMYLSGDWQLPKRLRLSGSRQSKLAAWKRAKNIIQPF